MTPEPVTCVGHQELRDMVIELKADVKHINAKLTELVEVAKTNHGRIVALETYNNQEIGRAEGVKAAATATSFVVSMVVSIVAVIISVVIR